MNIPSGLPVTPAQTEYVRGMQKRLHLPDRMLDDHCVARFRVTFAALDRAQVSSLIDEMKGWAGIPAQLLREAGQRDLPGFEVTR